MTVKTTGAEFKRFYNDVEFWPDHSDPTDKREIWHEDEAITVDGRDVAEYEFVADEVPDSASMTIEGGVVLGVSGDDDPSLETYFRRWKKKQTTVSMVVECPRERLDEVKAAVKAAGGRALT